MTKKLERPEWAPKLNEETSDIGWFGPGGAGGYADDYQGLNWRSVGQIGSETEDCVLEGGKCPKCQTTVGFPSSWEYDKIQQEELITKDSRTVGYRWFCKNCNTLLGWMVYSKTHNVMHDYNEITCR